MKIGMIGIGDIAQKAYLPVVTRVKDIEIALCSRNEELLKELMRSYRGLTYFTDVDQLIASGIDAVFVHAATSAHYGICKKLLEHGIHVYVDKPISYDIEETRQLYELAKEKNVILRVGFNRRRAPLMQELKEIGNPDIILYQKNRVNQPAPIREYIYDDFIHVVDSIRFLLEDDEVSYNVKGKVENNLLYSVTLQLLGEHAVAVGVMNRESGRTEEKVEYISPGEKRIIEDLNTLTVYRNGVETRKKFGDWDPVLYRRGFHQIVEEFIMDIESGQGFVASDEDSLITHELCELIVDQLETLYQTE